MSLDQQHKSLTDTTGKMVDVWAEIAKLFSRLPKIIKDSIASVNDAEEG